jgi:molecular chaperone DnaK (HSP70)
MSLLFYILEALALASAKAGIKVVDCVFVVPNYFTHHQRQGLLDAAKIAEGNVLAFMNTGKYQSGESREKKKI